MIFNSLLAQKVGAWPAGGFAALRRRLDQITPDAATSSR